MRGNTGAWYSICQLGSSKANLLCLSLYISGIDDSQTIDQSGPSNVEQRFSNAGIRSKPSAHAYD